MDIEEWKRWYRLAGEAGIRTILNEQWHPIGLMDYSPDEYDAYIPQVAGALRRGDAAADIAAYLSRVRTVTMELRADAGADLQVAHTLRDWYATATNEGLG